MVINVVLKFNIIITGTRGLLPCLLSFCVFDYKLIDAVGVFAVGYQLVALFKQASKDEVVF